MLSRSLSLRLSTRFRNCNLQPWTPGPIDGSIKYSRCLHSKSRLAHDWNRTPEEEASYQDFLKHNIVGDLGLTDAQITAVYRDSNINALGELCAAKWGRTFRWSPAAQMERYRAEYLSQGYETWGWRIYRTTKFDTVSDDERFSDFMRMFYDAMRKAMKEHMGHDDHIRFMHFPVVQDRFWSGKHTTWLRSDYRRWLRDGGAVLSEPKMLREKGLGNMSLSGPKYEYFIQVDEPSLNSVLKHQEGGYVNVVKVDWPSDREHDHDGICDMREFEEVDGDEGRTAHDVGFMQMGLTGLYPQLWNDLDTVGDEWKGVYVRPTHNGRESE